MPQNYHRNGSIHSLRPLTSDLQSPTSGLFQLCALVALRENVYAFMDVPIFLSVIKPEVIELFTVVPTLYKYASPLLKGKGGTPISYFPPPSRLPPNSPHPHSPIMLTKQDLGFRI